MARLPEARSRIRTDTNIRAEATIPDDSPCAHQGIGTPDYCDGPIMAEHINRPAWGDPTTADNVETLCSAHHHLKAMNRYRDAFLRDQEHTLNRR